MGTSNKPDGKSGGQRVAFNRRDAQRIANVVRTVEQGKRDGSALTFGSGIKASSRMLPQQTTNITVLTFAQLGTAGLAFQAVQIPVVAFTTAASVIIPIDNCPSVSVSAEGQAFFYG